jgi:hypothetical protein
MFTVTAGTYTYLVTDANGCTSTATITVSQPSQLMVTATTGSILCNGGTTTVNISANGGTAPYSGTGVFTVTAGTYTFVVTDANSNTTQTVVTIGQPSQLIASATAGTIGGFGGTTTVNVSANGGTAPYSGTGIFTVTAGTYIYLVTDANGCTSTVTVTITEPSQLTVTVTTGSILCNGGTTTVNITANGGTTPNTGTGIFTVTAGTYTFVVTDANSNSTQTVVSITQPSQLIATANSGTILCNGGTTTVNVTANGGTAPYSGTGLFTVTAGTYT